MRIWLWLSLILYVLVGPLWAHEGEDHADLREGRKSTPAGPALNVDLKFQAQGKAYSVHLVQMPARPLPGQEVQLEFVLKQELNPPDPLLGSEITVEGAEFQVQVEGGPALGPTHPEADPGKYGVHWTPDRTGNSKLIFTAANGLSFDYTLTVAWPLRQKLAVGVAGGLVLVTLVFGLIRRRFYAGGWVFAVVSAGVALAVGFWPTSPAPPPDTTAHTESKGSGLTIPLELQQDLEMKVARVERRNLRRNLSVPGQVRVAEGSRHTLHARFPARILSAGPRVGQRVLAGQQLAVLEEVLSSADRATLRSQSVELKSRELEFATRQTELKRQIVELQTRRQVAATELRQKRLDLRRAEQLYAISVIPLKELQASRTALRQAEQEIAGLARELNVLRAAPLPPELPPAVPLQQYVLSSPVSGVIARVDAAVEEVVDPTKVLFEVVDLTTVWVSARVSEADLGAVRQYGRATVRVPAYQESFSARFVSVAPTLDPETRTAQVYFAVDNQAGKLLDGMSAKVEMQGGQESVLAVPSQAVLTFEGESRVFVQVAEDRFEPRGVTVARNLGEMAVVEQGLEIGTRVVVSGVGALASELARRGENHD